MQGIEVRGDGLDPRELTTLDAIELGHLLNEIDQQTAAFTRVATNGWRALGEAESELVLRPDNPQLQALVKRTRANIKAASIQLSALRLRQSRIQTILRTLGPAL